MRLTKRQLKRIIREEYSRLQRRGLIRESNVKSSRRRLAEMGGDMMGEYLRLQGAEKEMVDDAIEETMHSQGMDAMAAFHDVMSAFLGGRL